ncbi:VOC family protein [Aridibaculum aurantiacum]|uniref:VOC family protein n=1 Tax=Aridibaculum aurantiacum TaxID=2810307 RepID=UPI001A95F51B|nr:VOC family protein [Aridibaculum aurantiacum]
MKISQIKETCLYVKDLEATRQFYHGKLGLPMISLVEGRHVFFRAGSSVLLCFIAAKTEQEKILPPHGASGVIHFAFEVAKADYAATLSELQQQHVKIVHEHEWPNGVRSCYFNDPDGHLVEIVEAGLWDK